MEDEKRPRQADSGRRSGRSSATWTTVVAEEGLRDAAGRVVPRAAARDVARHTAIGALPRTWLRFALVPRVPGVRARVRAPRQLRLAMEAVDARVMAPGDRVGCCVA